MTYHQLGRVAQERRDFEEAERWYQRSLEVSERLGDEHGAAGTYGQLGIIAGLQERYIESGQWLLKCILTFTRASDPRSAQGNAENFLVTLRNAPPEDRARLRTMWTETGLPDLPENSETK